MIIHVAILLSGYNLPLVQVSIKICFMFENILLNISGSGLKCVCP